MQISAPVRVFICAQLLTMRTQPGRGVRSRSRGTDTRDQLRSQVTPAAAECAPGCCMQRQCTGRQMPQPAGEPGVWGEGGSEKGAKVCAGLNAPRGKSPKMEHAMGKTIARGGHATSN